MRKFIAPVVALSVLAASQLSAATFTLTPVVTESFLPDFTPIPGAPDTTTMNGAARVFKVEFHIATSNLQAGEAGFGSVAFSVNGLNLGLFDAAGGYQPNGATTDSNGAAPGGTVPVFANNGDQGVAGDLIGIYANIANGITAPAVTDTRLKVGQAGGVSRVGEVYVQWDANSLQTLSLVGNGPVGPEFVTYTTAGQLGALQNVLSESVSFGSEIPEPATVALAGMALVGLIAVRRRKA
jgi:hypothetical protein